MKKILTPNLDDVLAALKRDIFRSLNCARIGKIQSFDKSKKTAEIELVDKRVLPDGKLLSHPKLVDCPVFTLQGGGSSIQFPIKKGDECIVLFADRNLDAWFKTGSETAPLDDRCHDFSDGIALVGVVSLVNKLDDYKDDTVRIKHGTAELSIDLTGKFTIKNQLANLGVLIGTLIDTIAAVQTTQNIPLRAADIAALQAQKLLFQQLLSSL